MAYLISTYTNAVGSALTVTLPCQTRKEAERLKSHIENAVDPIRGGKLSVNWKSKIVDKDGAKCK